MSSDFVKYPQGHVLLRNLSRSYPVIDRGERMYLWDKTGKRYIDAAGGALVNSLGHGNKELAEFVAAQMSRVAYVNGTQFTSEAMEEFATRLVRFMPKGLDRVQLLASGSEAVESAVKFCRQLWVERGEPKRSKVIARSPGYHGNTLFALSASARPHYKKFFGPLLHDVSMVSTPYEYRFSGGDFSRDGADFYAAELEALLQRVGPETVAAMLLEPVSGSSAGASTPPPGYFEKLSAVCRKHGILMISDEILCGSGRCGEFSASKLYGFEPDLLVLGKGINSGLVPMSALVVKDEHLLEMKRGSGGFMHAQTYLQSPVMAAAGLAVLKFMDEHDVLSHAKSLGLEFQSILKQRLVQLPTVGSVAGVGMLAGVEFVESKESKKAFDRERKFAERFTQHCFERGLIVWPNVGQADGVNGDLVMLGPPLNSKMNEVEELVAALEGAIESFSLL
jgi:adenosylmethionine-8-amino-7-oxononanoate aminotransferase